MVFGFRRDLFYRVLLLASNVFLVCFLVSCLKYLGCSWVGKVDLENVFEEFFNLLIKNQHCKPADASSRYQLQLVLFGLTVVSFSFVD